MEVLRTHISMFTVELVAKEIRYARYDPMLYYKGEISQPEGLRYGTWGAHENSAGEAVGE